MTERPKSILIVDDNKTFSMYAGMLLRRMGFEVVAAKDGLEALGFLKAFRPDLILLDVAMPRMDGITTLRHLQDEGIPVIMVSVDSSPETLANCEKWGSCAYLTKPVSPRTLHQAVFSRALFPVGELRKNLRVAYEDRVLLTHEDQVHHLQAVSLSEGGIYLRMPHPLPKDTRVSLSLFLSPEPLTVEALVIYRREVFQGAFRKDAGMALKFVDLDEPTRDLLSNHVSALLTAETH